MQYQYMYSFEEMELELTEQHIASRRQLPSQTELNYSCSVECSEPSQTSIRELPSIQLHSQLMGTNGQTGNSQTLGGGHSKHKRKESSQIKLPCIDVAPNSPGSSNGSPVIHKKRSHSNDIFKGKTSPLKRRSKTLLNRIDSNLKENQEVYDQVISRAKEDKKRSQPSVLLTFRGEKFDLKKCGNAFDMEGTADQTISSVFGKKLRIERDEATEKKYFQRMNLLRQTSNGATRGTGIILNGY